MRRDEQPLITRQNPASLMPSSSTFRAQLPELLEQTQKVDCCSLCRGPKDLPPTLAMCVQSTTAGVLTGCRPSNVPILLVMHIFCAFKEQKCAFSLDSAHNFLTLSYHVGSGLTPKRRSVWRLQIPISVQARVHKHIQRRLAAGLLG